MTMRGKLLIRGRATVYRQMSAGGQEFEIDGRRIAEGTALYDTEHHRVLWVTNIDAMAVTVEPFTPYPVVEPLGHTPANDNHVVTNNTVCSRPTLSRHLREGRLTVSPP